MEARPLDWEKPDSTAARVAVRGSSLMRSVNDSIRRLSGTFTYSEPIAFFCECRRPTCYAAVSMSAEAFDWASQTGWVILEGHEPSVPWRLTEAPPARERTRSRVAPRATEIQAASIGRHWDTKFRRRLAAAGTSSRSRLDRDYPGGAGHEPTPSASHP